MKIETIDKIKKDIEKANKDAERISAMSELEQRPDVIRYMNLMGIKPTSYETKTSEERLIDIIRRYEIAIKPSETNDIYIYLGSFIKRNDEVLKCPKNEENVSSVKYRNIEQAYEVTIQSTEQESFENDHTTISMNGRYGTTKEEFEKMQREFFENAISTNQEKAKQYIIKKYNIRKGE